ncbi:MAG: hypothetical protein GKC01_06545, partial [Candidatus Methanofastidiosa archaeon]|nr:hypothetical protein [Candidatus Methanofastidiosa archaeon]
DIVNKNNKIEVNRFIGRGVLVDISKCSEGPISLENISNKRLVKKDDFVFFRSCWSKNVGEEKYFDHPELSFEVIEWLSKKKVNMVGIDALGLGKGKNHGKYDRYLVDKSIYVIENLTNLDLIKDEVFTVYCFPLNMENLEAIPARVVVQV